MMENLSGSKALKDMLKELNGKCVDTGWFETARYPSDERRGRKGGEYVAEVAYWLNTGTPRMVARPFFSEAVYGNENEIRAFAKKQIAKVIEGKLDIDAALGQIGLLIEGFVLYNIKSQRYAKLSDDYYDWKKQFHENPQILIDTGLLWQSLISKVGEDPGDENAR